MKKRDREIKAMLKPLWGNVLVKPLEEPSVTKSGIHIPKTSDKERTKKGLVLRLGTGPRDEEGNEEEWRVSEGDYIVYKRYSAEEIYFGDDTYLIIDQQDIYAIIEGEESEIIGHKVIYG